MDEKPGFFLSSRGARKLSFQGYSYGKDRLDPKTGKCYWKCDNRKCKGRIITSSDDRILKQTAHNMHGPDIPKIEVQHSMARIREAASKTQEAPSKILNKELAKDLPAEFRGYWPKEPTMKRSIQRQRRKFIPELPKSLNDLTIPEAWQKSSKGDQWLLCDIRFEEGSERVIIFCTDENLQHLCRSDVWYGDGTFSVAQTSTSSWRG